jgi:hypothetical protein
MKCEACERGDHANCGMQSWCDCTDERDGDVYAEPDPVALDEWDVNEEDGPQDLEDQLEAALDRAFPPK